MPIRNCYAYRETYNSHASSFYKIKQLFTSLDTEYFESIANFISLSLENSMLYSEIKKKSIELETLSITDGLTSLYNHRYLLGRLDFEFNRSKRYKHELCFVMMDLDNFKKINDNYGHQIGDIILKKVSDIIKNKCRKVDIPARYGGDEFAIILSNTPYSGALILSERIQNAVKNISLKIGKNKITTSISVGISQVKEVSNVKQLMKNADKTLYKNKKNNFNHKK